jgi:hypothetical protein
MLKRGIILFACGHSLYGRYAYNFALSVKAVDPLFPVVVVHSENSLSHVSEDKRWVFDQMILLPGGTGFGVKLQLDLLSPFEETLYCDVDMAWLPKRSPNDLFDELKDVDFTSITEGHTEDKSQKYYFWADPEEIRKKYSIEGRMYQWRSEVMYFKKTDKVRQMFAMARKIHANHGLDSVVKFGNQIPDELAINIATAFYDMHPHEYKWTPAFWPRLHGNNYGSQVDLYNKFYLLSCGSNYATGDLKRLYNQVMKIACAKFRTQHVFPLQDKKGLIPDRAKR